MKTKEGLKKVSTYIILFFIMITIFCIAMIVTYALPNERIQFHIRESRDILSKNIEDPFFLNYVKSGKLDTFTDLLILNTAMNRGMSEDESIFIRAFENSRYSEDNVSQYELLSKLTENEDLYNNQEYARYWHGIQTIVRPLLMFFNYEEIRYLFMIIMFMLLMGATILIYKNLSIFHASCFMFSMLVVNFFIIPMSLQFTSVFAIMLIAVIIINILYKVKKEKYLPYMFFIMGGVTNFFDLLTVPLITLGIPLIAVILLRNKNNCDIKKTIIELIKLSMFWAISYVLVFFVKWIIASIILQKDIITDSIEQILFRTNGSDKYPATRLGAIGINIEYLYNSVLLLFGILIGITWIIALVKKRKKIRDMKKAIPLILVAIYPYIWYAVIAGHSTIHAFFTYRIQAIMIFGILCAMLETIQLQQPTKLSKKEIKYGKNSSLDSML